MQKEDALALARSATTLYSARGKKVAELDLSSGQANEEEILALMLGPTGNLRAPVLREGNKLIVGFNEELYKEVLK